MDAQGGTRVTAQVERTQSDTTVTDSIDIYLLHARHGSKCWEVAKANKARGESICNIHLTGNATLAIDVMHVTLES